MSCSLKADFSVSGSSSILVKNNGNGGSSSRVWPSIEHLQFRRSNPKDFWGKTLDSIDQKGVSTLSIKSPKWNPVYAYASGPFGKSLRWWEKSLQPNMVEIGSAQELVDNLLNAGDGLVIVDFYSPGCGGCKSLHPKICQIAGLNPNVVFLMVNTEEHKQMCHALHVHVLPFFRFYQGSEGRLCSFSCTNATIKKFKDALAKHGTERCSIGPAKGLSEAELLALAEIGQIPRDLVPETTEEEKVGDVKEFATSKASSSKGDMMGLKKEDDAMAMAGY